MQFLKNVKTKLAIGALCVGLSGYSNAFWFTGGPTLDYSNLSENVLQNLDQIEQHLEELANMKALRKILKEKVKQSLKSTSDKSMAIVKQDQELTTAETNHDVVVEMAPADIPGCFSNDSRVSSDEIEAEI